MVAVALRIRSGSQRDFLEHIAVDHGDRARILLGLHGVHEQRGRDAFKGEVHVADWKATHGELAPKVVACRDARQDVNGPHRIIRDDATELLKLVASEHLLATFRAIVLTGGGAHVDRLRIGARYPQ